MVYYLILTTIPFAIVSAFCIHWYTISGEPSPEKRLEISRGVYLGFSFQVLVFAWLLYQLGHSRFAFPLYAIAFSMIGDWFNLQFPLAKRYMKDPVLGGIFSFAIAQVFFLVAFRQLISWEELFSSARPIIISLIFLILPAVIFYFRVYNPNRSKWVMVSAFLYGILLCFFVSLCVNAYLLYGGVWIYLAIGAGFFLLSDAVMGETTINGTRHPKWEFQVPWITYLIAQCFLIVGFFLVSHTRLIAH
ncbi:lysoplasmalogenase family protein [Leptospira sp. WS39.C2]